MNFSPQWYVVIFALLLVAAASMIVWMITGQAFSFVEVCNWLLQMFVRLR